jgi:hypothetical protein
MKEFLRFRRMCPDAKAITVHALVNRFAVGSAMIDTGCLTAAFVSAGFARQARLEVIDIGKRTIQVATGDTRLVKEAARIHLDIDGHQETIWAYVLKGDDAYDMILGRPWMDKNDVRLAPKAKTVYIHSSGIWVRSTEEKRLPLDLREIGSKEFKIWMRRSKKASGSVGKHVVKLFSVSLKDIQKALTPKAYLAEDPGRSSLHTSTGNTRPSSGRKPTSWHRIVQGWITAYHC